MERRTPRVVRFVMKGIKLFIGALGLFAAMSIAGCGGAGNKDAVIDGFVSDVTRAIETQNLSAISNLIDEDYLNSCYTKDDLVAGYADVFDTPDLDYIDVNSLEVSERYVDMDSGYAQFFWRDQWTTYYTDGTHDTSTAAGMVYLVRYGGKWREYGNQLCSGGAKSAVGPLNGLKPSRVK